jgi:hypothetical protein
MSKEEVAVTAPNVRSGREIIPISARHQLKIAPKITYKTSRATVDRDVVLHTRQHTQEETRDPPKIAL